MKASRSISRLIFVASLAALAGCAHYQPAPVFPRETQRKFELRSLTDRGLREFIATNAPELAKETPLPSWDLSALTLAAFYYHADIEVARAKLASAEAAIFTAGARPNPSIGFSPTYDVNSAAGVSPWTLGFSLDVPIETAGKRGYRIAQAQYLANAARLNVASTSWRVRSRVRKSLLDLYSANLTRDVLTNQEAAQSRAVGLLEDRLKAGQSSLLEVQIVRVAAAQTALQLREAQKQSAQARVRLADALGLSVSALENATLSFAGFQRAEPLQNTEALRREALLNRADLLGALAEHEAAQSALQLELARQYPDVHLGPGYAWDQGENKFTLGVSLTLPVLNQNQGPIAEAEAHRREAAAAFVALQARIIGQVDEAIAGYRDALRKLTTAEELLAAQRKRMQAVQESFEAGAADRLELSQTEIELHAGELAHAQASVEAQQALGALEDAMQRPTDVAATKQLSPAVNKN